MCSCSVSWCPSLACWLRLLCCQCLAVPGGSGFLPAGVAPCVLGASCAPCSAVAGLCLALVCLIGWLCGLRCWVCEGGRLFACPAVGPLRSPLIVPAPRQRLCFWGLGPGFLAGKHVNLIITSHTGGAIPCGGLASQRSARVTAPPPPRGQVLPAPLQPPGRPKSSGPGGWAPSPQRTGRAALTGARASSPQAGSRQQSAARRRPCADSPTARPTAAPGWRGGRAHQLAVGGGAGPPRPGRPHAARPAPGGGRPAGGPWRH